MARGCGCLAARASARSQLIPTTASVARTPTNASRCLGEAKPKLIEDAPRHQSWVVPQLKPESASLAVPAGTHFTKFVRGDRRVARPMALRPRPLADLWPTLVINELCDA